MLLYVLTYSTSYCLVTASGMYIRMYLAPSVLPMIISMLLYIGVSYWVVFKSSGTQTNYLARSGGYESPGLLSINVEIPNY